MKYLSAAEAGRIIGVTEKTVRTWITQGRLTAHHVTKNRLAIPENEVTALARERGQYQAGEIPSVTDLAREVEQLRQEIEQARARIADLEARQLTARPAALDDYGKEEEESEAAAWSPGVSERPRATRRPVTSSETLLAGAVLARHFAEQHGVNPNTFRDHVTKGIRGDIAPVSTRPKPSRPRETEYYVLPEQRAGIYAFWQRHNVAYHVDDEKETRQEGAEAAYLQSDV